MSGAMSVTGPLLLLLCLRAPPSSAGTPVSEFVARLAEPNLEEQSTTTLSSAQIDTEATTAAIETIRFAQIAQEDHVDTAGEAPPAKEKNKQVVAMIKEGKVGLLTPKVVSFIGRKVMREPENSDAVKLKLTTQQVQTRLTGETTIKSRLNIQITSVNMDTSSRDPSTIKLKSIDDPGRGSEYTDSLISTPASSSSSVDIDVQSKSLQSMGGQGVYSTELSSVTEQVDEAGVAAGPLSGPHIDGIEAHLEEPAGSDTVVHHIPTAVEEKLEALLCDVPPLPSQSQLWNGNQTRDLKLPVVIPFDCEADDLECPEQLTLSWEGYAEVQTGDVLLLRIDDHALLHHSLTSNLTRRTDWYGVYGVSKAGYEHCDVSDGNLLDITPLVVDSEKLITLYDKDLTEGVNLLIVVSERWGRQCIRLRVSVKSDNCGENADCSNKGVCFSNASMEGFECGCCAGYIGAHCEEKDACYPSPCHNNGICVDLSQGHDGQTYQCLCPYGYSGKQCQDESDPCESSPCKHGGRCHWNQTSYYCECTAGYAGDHCQHSANVCAEAPCKHGMCVPQGDTYACFCKPGYAGDNCDFEYNECESSPCENSATCTDGVNGYQCLCGRGFTGKRCNLKVDLCDPDPCAEGRICIDRGNNYSCDCPPTYTGPQCTQSIRAVCSSNPCHHGGTCWGSSKSFYCACAPPYTGNTCDQLVHSDDTTSSGQDDLAALQLDKIHSIYIAVGTLSCALLFVILTIAVCHCRVQEMYKKCFVNSTPLLPCKVRRLNILPRQPWSGKALFEREREMMTSPTVDAHQVYYTLDFTGNPQVPLIQ